MSKDLVEHQCSIRGRVMLNAYTGGSKNPRCVQLSVSTTQNAEYVQMPFHEAKQLFLKMLIEIARTEQEYDETPPWWEELQKSGKLKKTTGEKEA